MGLLTRIVHGTIEARRRTGDPRQPNQYDQAFIQRTVAGVVMSPRQALGVSAVWACITYRSETVGQLPWSVLLRGKDGKRQIATGTPAYYLLHTSPNPEWTPQQFKQTMVAWRDLWGNAYAEIERDDYGRPVALWPIHPERVQAMRDWTSNDPAVRGRLFYRVSNISNAGSSQDAWVDLLPQDMFHIRGMGDDVVGFNPMSFAAESIGWARAAMLFGASFFGNNLNLGGIVSVEGSLTTGGKDAFEKSLNQKHQGPRKAWRFHVMDRKADFKPFGVKPNEGQFIETNQHLIEEVCRWFRVPPHKVMHLLRAHFNNVEHQNIDVVVDCITPIVISLEQEADRKLFGSNRPGYYTKMNLRALLRGDFKTQQEGLEVQRRNGVITTDEWREFVDMDPVGAEEGGDLLLVQAQQVKLKDAGKAMNAKTGAVETDPPEDEPEPDDPETATEDDDDDDVPQDVIEQMARITALLPPPAKVPPTNVHILEPAAE